MDRRIFKPPLTAAMHLFVRDDRSPSKAVALHPICEIRGEHLDQGGVPIDFEDVVVVVYNDRAQLALRCIDNNGNLSNHYLLIEEMGGDAAQLARGWSIQCREAVSTSIPEFKVEAECAMAEARALVLGEVRKYLFFPRPKLAFAK